MKITNKTELATGETISIGVFELLDLFTRRNAKLPNVFVIRYRTVDFGDVDAMLSGHRRVRNSLIRFRPDLGIRASFKSIELANEAWKSLQKNLSNDGYSVNPSTSNEHSVYVFELSPKRLGEKRVYVGQTTNTVERRLEQHLAGGKLSSKCVRNDFVRRLEHLEPARRFHSLSDAEAEETALGLKLLAAGYRVCGPNDLPADSDA